MKIHQYKEMMKYLTRPDVSNIPIPVPQAPAEPRELSNEEHAAILNERAQTEQSYATGGRVEMARGGDPEKIARIKELVQSGDYNKKQIIDLLEKEGYGRVRSGKDSVVNTIADELKIDLPVGMTEKGLAIHEAKGKYLPFYNNEKLEADLKEGKTVSEISKDLYNNNKKFYNKIGIAEDNIAVLNNAISSKLRKNEDFVKLNNDNLSENVKQQKQVLNDVNSFIKDNKEKYLDLYNSNKVGAPDKFKNDLINFIEDKHPDFVKTTKEYISKNPLAKGSKVLDLPDLYEREVTRAGDYGRDIFLKKKIRESLGIAERPGKGEGISLDRMARNYNTTTQELLEKALEKGTIPKTNPFNNKPINNVSKYYAYAKQAGIDPVNKLFEGQVRFGVEHVGGIARAGKINDYETLDKVLAFDSNVNRGIKSTAYDNRLTRLVDIAKQSDTETAKKYVKIINSLVAEGEEKYGIPLTKYKMVGDELTAIHPNISLTDSTFKKAKLAINHFITNDGLNHPNFEKLDPDLQKAIVNYSKDKTKEADSLLKGVIKQKGLSAEVIPGMQSILDNRILNQLVESGSPIAGNIIKGAAAYAKASGGAFNIGLGAVLNSPDLQKAGLGTGESLYYGATKTFFQDTPNFAMGLLKASPIGTTAKAIGQVMSGDEEGLKKDILKSPKEKLLDSVGTILNDDTVDISEIPGFGHKPAVRNKNIKELIDKEAELKFREEQNRMNPYPPVTDFGPVEGTQDYMTEEEARNAKNKHYKNIFTEHPEKRDAYLKQLFNDLEKERQNQGVEVKPKGLYNVDVIKPNALEEMATGGRVGYAEGSNDELEIPTLNSKETPMTGIYNAKSKRLESLSPYESYSEQEILGNIESKLPHLSIDENRFYGMPQYAPGHIIDKATDVMPNVLTTPKNEDGIISLATGGRASFQTGGSANFLKMLRNISDSILDIKNSTHILGSTAKSQGIAKAAEEALIPYKNIPTQNKQTTVLEAINKAKEHLPKEYHGILDEMKSYADKHAYDAVDDMAKALDKVIDPNLKFESLPKHMFPMEDPLNDAFIIMDPERNHMTGRYVHSVRIDPETGRGTRETFDTFDSKTRTFLKKEDWKPVGVESIEKGKEGLN